MWQGHLQLDLSGEMFQNLQLLSSLCHNILVRSTNSALVKKDTMVRKLQIVISCWTEFKDMKLKRCIPVGVSPIRTSPISNWPHIKEHKAWETYKTLPKVLRKLFLNASPANIPSESQVHMYAFPWSALGQPHQRQFHPLPGLQHSDSSKMKIRGPWQGLD